MTERFDVVVLGAGPGGYVAAIRASQLGLRTAIIEKQYWGGVCLNVGCIPSKSLLRNAELAHLVQDRADEFGFSGGPITADYRAAFVRSRSVAGSRVKGVHYLMKKNSITEFSGSGTFIDPHRIEVVGTDGATTTVEFDHAIIATGSTTKLLPGTTLSANVVTYEEQIMASELPGSILIVGAGAIGMEFGYVLTNYGVDVTIVEYLDRVLPNEDPDVSAVLRKQYAKLGVTIKTATAVSDLRDDGSKVTVTLTDNATSHTETIVVDKVMQSVGFVPRVDGFGLEATGVALTAGGAIEISDRMQTSVPHLYAIGDVTAKLQLAHVAEAQALVAAETIAGHDTDPIVDYRMMPRATFCQPQVASFGLTEQQATEDAAARGSSIRTATFPFTANGKAHGLGEPIGFVKLIADDEYGELLGAHLVGPDVSELLPELTLAQRWDLTVYELAKNVHTHPTLSEALQEAIHGLAGHMINM
jgi:dihydrolipoamide dehydrogenase